MNLKQLYTENRISDEPFILATQAEQVWYIQDPVDTDWSVVMRMTARDNFDVYTTENSTKSTPITLFQPFNGQDFDENVTDIEYSWVREGVEGMEVDSENQEDHNTQIDMDEKYFFYRITGRHFFCLLKLNSVLNWSIDFSFLFL